jgi:hypothetical protein
MAAPAELPIDDRTLRSFGIGKVFKACLHTCLAFISVHPSSSAQPARPCTKAACESLRRGRRYRVPSPSAVQDGAGRANSMDFCRTHDLLVSCSCDAPCGPPAAQPPAACVWASKPSLLPSKSLFTAPRPSHHRSSERTTTASVCMTCWLGDTCVLPASRRPCSPASPRTHTRTRLSCESWSAAPSDHTCTSPAGPAGGVCAEPKVRRGVHPLHARVRLRAVRVAKGVRRRVLRCLPPHHHHRHQPRPAPAAASSLALRRGPAPRSPPTLPWWQRRTLHTGCATAWGPSRPARAASLPLHAPLAPIPIAPPPPATYCAALPPHAPPLPCSARSRRTRPASPSSPRRRTPSATTACTPTSTSATSTDTPRR